MYRDFHNHRILLLPLAWVICSLLGGGEGRTGTARARPVAAGAQADAESSDLERVIILTVDDKLLDGTLVGYESGFLVLRQSTEEVQVSPKHTRAVFTDLGLASAFAESPDLLSRQMAVQAELAYFNLPPPESETSTEKFFSYCMDESMQIALAYAGAGGEALQERLRDLSEAGKKAGRDVQSLLKPDQYRPLLLMVAMKRIVIAALVKRAKIRPTRDGVREALQAAQHLGQAYQTLEQGIRTADIGRDAREVAKRRLKLLHDEWHLRAYAQPASPLRERPSWRDRGGRGGRRQE